jgi:hypothetical protein
MDDPCSSKQQTKVPQIHPTSKNLRRCVNLEKLVVAQVTKKSLAFYHTSRFITLFTVGPILSHMNAVYTLAPYDFLIFPVHFT